MDKPGLAEHLYFAGGIPYFAFCTLHFAFFIYPLLWLRP